MISVRESTLEAIQFLRDVYRVEMNCQIVHDSIHERRGWTREYALALNRTVIGYGSVAVAGPWSGRGGIEDKVWVRPHPVPSPSPETLPHTLTLILILDP